MKTNADFLRGKHIAFLGDSITLGYSLSRCEDRFATLICRELNAVEENYGITGTLMARAGLNRSDDRSYVDRAPLIRNADIAVIFGGTNDYFWSDSPIYPPQTSDSSTAYFANAVHAILKYCEDIGKSASTLIVTPYPHNGIGNYLGGETWQTSSRHDTSAVNFNGHTLSDYVRVLSDEAEKFKMPILNLHEAPEFDWENMTTDGCHPNAAGHIWLAEKIKSKLLEM